MPRSLLSTLRNRLRTPAVPAFVLATALATGPACTETDPTKPATWIARLDRTNPKDVADAARELRKMRAKEAVPALLPLLGHDDASVRDEVAYALLEIGDPAAVQPLIDAVDLDSRIKGIGRANMRIAEALGELGDKSAVPALLKMTSARDDLVRLSAVAALGKLKDPKAVSTLVRFVDDEHTPPLITKKAVEALGDMRAADAVPSLLRGLVLERKGVSFYVESSYALFQIGQPAVQPLIELAAGENKEYVAWADEARRHPAGYLSKSAVVLSDLGAKEAVPVLVKLLNWNDPDGNPVFEMLVRGTAADALGRLRAPEGAAAIGAQMGIEEANIREKFAYALAHIGDARQLPKLAAAARKGSWSARKSAITGLALLGDGKQKSVLEAIIKQETPDAAFKSCMDEPGAPMESKDAKTARCELQRTERPKFLQEELARLLSADECGKDVACWTGKLSSDNARVRERAAYELGKLQDPSAIPALVKAGADEHLLARRAAFIALDWFAMNPATKDAAKAAAEPLSKQLAEEEGRAHTKVVNEDLRRVVWKLARG